MNYKKLIRFFLGLSVILSSSIYASVEDRFNAIKSDPNALYAFFRQMPKGGELHYHLAGGAFPEVMLTIAAKQLYCLSLPSYQINAKKDICSGIAMENLKEKPEQYARAIREWSLKDFVASANHTAHDHFFATFAKFGYLVQNNPVPLLADVIKRAANQHEQYLEVMILPDSQNLNFPGDKKDFQDFKTFKQKLLNDASFNKEADYIRQTSDDLVKKTQDYLGCQHSPQKAACHVHLRFIYYVLREQAIEKVFSQALLGFTAASKSSSIVGVNLVEAEDGYISLHDYSKQMRIFEFMHDNFPKVNVSLHAGEITPELVRPEDLRFHINMAVRTGHAQRIGHGVDIAFEDNSKALLAKMAKDKIAVEINLVSNEKLLGINKAQHPLNFYLAHGVPVVLSTDDEGILRTDLTSQYVKAVIEHHLDYPTIKNINRNALTYSFLPGQSLWSKAGLIACKNFKSSQCNDFVLNNEKAKLQQQLEYKIVKFEEKYR